MLAKSLQAFEIYYNKIHIHTQTQRIKNKENINLETETNIFISFKTFLLSLMFETVPQLMHFICLIWIMTTMKPRAWRAAEKEQINIHVNM